MITSSKKNEKVRSTVGVLRKVKEHSDKGRYEIKAQMLRELMKRKASEFEVDSEKDGIVGITHKPSGFKVHIPRKVINDLGISKAAQVGAKEIALMGLGGLATGVPLLTWYANRQPADPDAIDTETGRKLRNYDVWKAKLAVQKALWRIARKDFDVDTTGDLGRVVVPYEKLDKDTLKYLKFKPSIVAVPERGQSSLLTYRQVDTNAHLHQHPDYWMMHKDKWPSIQMFPAHLKNDPNMDISEFFEASSKHGKIEGVRGWLRWLRALIKGNLTYDEIIKAKTEPDKYPDLVKRYNEELERRNREILLELEKAKTKKADVKKSSKIVPLMVKNAKVYAVLAETDDECATGLGHIRKLEDGTGMLFTKASSYFWMKNMHVPLDLMYLDKFGEVLDIHSMPVEHNPAYPCKLYKSACPEKTAMALEVPEGWCSRNNISIGDKVYLKK